MSNLSLPSTETSVLSTVVNNLSKGWYSYIVSGGGNNPEKLFFDPKNQALFHAIQDAYESGGHPTLSSIEDRLEEKYSHNFDDVSAFLTNIQLSPPVTTIEQMETSIDKLAQYRELRRQISGIEQVLEDINDPDIDAIPQDVATRLQDIVDTTESAAETETFGDIVSSVLESPRAMWNISTGVDVIDSALGGKGFESGCLTIAAARPKVGKTILMNSLINSVLENGGIPLVLNLETKRIEFAAKTIARHIADENLGWGEVKDYLRLRDHADEDVMSEEEKAVFNNLSKTQKNSIDKAIRWAEKQDWYVSFDKNMSIQDIHSLAMKAKADYPVDSKIVLFVDYIQLQVQNSFREREEITNLSRFYKKLAGSLDIHVFALAQLNRDAAGNRPQVSQLRGSGSLEQDADTILLLDRPHNHDDTRPKYILEIIAETTRLAQGGTEECFIDGASQIVCNMPDELKSITDDDSELFEAVN